jgi:hypothetical protein
MTEAQQRRGFGEAGMKAIADGADLTQVVNARRGMTTVTRYGRTVQATREGTTRRGLYGSRRAKFEKVLGARYARAKAPRLMPEEIYRLAKDREHAIRLLQRNGYLFASDSPSTPSPGAVPSPREPVHGQGGRGERGGPPAPPPLDSPQAGGDEVPLLGDLLPDASGEADTERLEAGVRALLEGVSFAGFTLEVTRVRPAPNRLGLTANVMRDGELAGEIWRTFKRDADGKLFAKHDIFELEVPFRRMGFSNAVNPHLEDWYRSSGVDRIELNAGMDNGGFVWARKGYDFATAEDAEGVSERLERQLDELEQWLDRHKNDDTVPDDVYEAREDEYADGEALLRRMHSEPFDSAGFPRARDIAALGRRPHHTPADTWLGKRLLMGSSWNGVKYL